MAMQHASQFALPGRRRRMALSLAPLIDVTFILLIFFMLVTQYTRLAPIDVKLGEISQVQLPEQAAAAPESKVQSRLTLRSDGSLDLDGRAVPNIAELPPVLRERGYQALQAVVAPSEQAQQKPVLLLAPDPDVNLQLLIDALSALDEAPMFAVRIAIPRQEAAP
jgi:biopolymer transport protein ExbD